MLLAAYAYAAQIYCDFSGYTDIAIGLALLMGFVFPQNFRSPYRATGFRDFWRRWHMTLSRFLRDFLYIPLGGNRNGRVRTYRNLMITMVLGGLWHGAAWTFVLWGALPRRRARRSSTRSAGADQAARLAALVRHLQPRRVRLDPLPLARASTSFWTYVAAAVRARARPTLWTGAGRSLALLAVIGLQLLPERTSRGHRRSRIERALARCCSASGSRRLSSSSARPSPARACPRSSTSASERLSDATTRASPRRQPDGALRRAEAAPLQRARRGRSRSS